MNRCEYCGEPYHPGVGCINPECPQRYAFHLRCNCGGAMYERSNGGDPNKRTYYCKDCKLYVFVDLDGDLEGFYCSQNGCVFKGKPTEYHYLSPLRTHRFVCPTCGKNYKIRRVDLAQWFELLERV